MANFAARSKMARFSLTPPTRQASIWTTSIASACSSCLKITRFWTCPPVATLTARIAARIVAWPSTSSGEVGSSIQYGSNGTSWPHHSIASLNPHPRFPARAHPPEPLPPPPSLVRVEGDAHVRTDGVAGHLEPPNVARHVGTDLQLDHREPVVDGGSGQAGDLLVVVPEPAGRCGVRAQAVGLQRGHPGRPAAGLGLQDRERVIRGKHVVDVGEVDLTDELLGLHRRQQPPQRHVVEPATQIP